MYDRLTGLETEFALRFSPAPGGAHPGNEILFEALRDAMGDLVILGRGDRFPGEQSFTENGGAFYYEMLPHAVDGGLIEFATPECRSPAELLLYQRAQERLLVDAIPGATENLERLACPGELSVLKNCRDAFGHIYGPQENYEADLGGGLWAFRVGVVLLLPLLAVTTVVYLAMSLVLLVTMFVVAISVGLAEAIAAGVPEVPRQWMSRTMSGFGAAGMAIEAVVTAPLVTPMMLLLRATAFRRIRRGITAHVISRPVYIGAGTLGEDGVFGLDEKGPAMRRTTRLSVLPGDRAIFEMGNIVKLLFGPMVLDPASLPRIFAARQRFQLGLSASNMAQHAEYLKVAVTGLVLDMAERGALDDAPQPRRPIADLRAFCADPTLSVSIRLRNGERMTALQIQRWYLRRAQRFLAESATASMEAHDVVRRWEETLDALKTDPDSLVGKVDWVTKRALLRAGEAEGLSAAALKKIDLRYHELGTGYFAELEAADLTRRLLDEGAIERAIREPPGDTPARQRARLLRTLRSGDEPVRVAWDRVRVGSRLGGTIIRLDDHR